MDNLIQFYEETAMTALSDPEAHCGDPNKDAFFDHSIIAMSSMGKALEYAQRIDGISAMTINNMAEIMRAWTVGHKLSILEGEQDG